MKNLQQKDHDAEYNRIFSPEHVQLLREIFHDTCKAHSVLPRATAQRDVLAAAILEAGRATMDVTKIRAAAFAAMVVY